MFFFSKQQHITSFPVRVFMHKCLSVCVSVFCCLYPKTKENCQPALFFPLANCNQNPHSSDQIVARFHHHHWCFVASCFWMQDNLQNKCAHQTPPNFFLFHKKTSVLTEGTRKLNIMFNMWFNKKKKKYKDFYYLTKADHGRFFCINFFMMPFVVVCVFCCKWQVSKTTKHMPVVSLRVVLQFFFCFRRKSFLIYKHLLKNWPFFLVYFVFLLFCLFVWFLLKSQSLYNWI